MPHWSVSLLTLCVLAVSCAHAQNYYGPNDYYYYNSATNPQNVNEASLQSQIANTGFNANSQLFCSRGNNSYSLQLYNGFVAPITATVTLACTQCASSFITSIIPAKRDSGVLSISPPGGCLVANRLCTITMQAQNPFVSYKDILTIGKPVQTSCGAPPVEDYQEDISYGNFPVMCTNGDWYHYGLFYLIVWITRLLVYVGLAAMVCALYEWSASAQHSLIGSTRVFQGLPDAQFNEFGMAAYNNFDTQSALPANNTPSGFGYAQGMASPGNAIVEQGNFYGQDNSKQVQMVSKAGSASAIMLTLSQRAHGGASSTFHTTS